MLTKWAFMYMSDGFSPAKNWDNHVNQDASVEFITVGFDPQKNTTSDYIDVVKKLKNQGVQSIECCGGFTDELIEQIAKSLNNSLPIGKVGYATTFSEQLKKIHGN